MIEMITLIGQIILNMGRYLKGYTLFLCLCILLAIPGIFPLSTVIAMTILLLIMLPVGSISPDMDQKDPSLSRRATVTARYLLVVLMALTGIVFGVTAGMFLSAAGTGEAASALETALLSLSVGLLMAGILLPLNYHFGTQQARRYLYPIVIIPMTVLLWRGRRAAEPDILSAGRLCALSLSALGLSYLISFRITAGDRSNSR